MTEHHPSNWTPSTVIALIALLVTVCALALTFGTLVWKAGGRDRDFLSQQDTAKKDHEAVMSALADLKRDEEKGQEQTRVALNYAAWMKQRVETIESRLHIKPVAAPFTLQIGVGSSASGSPPGSTPREMKPRGKDPR